VNFSDSKNWTAAIKVVGTEVIQNADGTVSTEFLTTKFDFVINYTPF